ncbi:hypothetical protein [Nigerium sp.]
MNFLLESANHVPVNIAIGVCVFVGLLLALGVVRGVGQSHPHS